MTYSFVEVVMPKFWIASGPPEYWKVAFEMGRIWGVTYKKSTQWKKLSSGDYILFYANKPVSGVIGYGVVKTKFRQDKPLWPREIEEGKVIWPYRFEFDVEYCLPQDEWEKRRVTSNYIAGAAIGGLKQIREEEAQKIINELVPAKPPSPLDGINSIENSLKKVLESAKLSFPITHECVELMLLRIGKQLGFHIYTADPSRTCDGISLKELADMDRDYLKRYAGDQFLDSLSRVDVIWHRSGEAFYVFEIVIGGNMKEALVRLLSVIELNAKMFVVATEDREREYRELIRMPGLNIIMGRCDFISIPQLIKMYVLTNLWRESVDKLKLPFIGG